MSKSLFIGTIRCYLLHRVTRIDPGGKSAEQGIRFFVTVLKQEERRTGARVFIRSGAVGDDPPTLFK